MVSATVPNIQDVARWVGNGNMGEPAIVKEAREESKYWPLMSDAFCCSSEKRIDLAS